MKSCKEMIQAPTGNCEVCGGTMYRSDGKSVDELVFEDSLELWQTWHE